MDTVPVTVDTNLLWLMEAVISQLGGGDEVERLDRDGLVRQIHEGLLFCTEHNESEATLLLTEDHCKLVSGMISPLHAIGTDVGAGRRLLLKVFEAERLLRYGPEPPVAKDFSPTKARTKEWLQEWLQADPGQT